MKLNLLRNFCAQLNLLHNTLCPLRPVKAQLVLVTKGCCFFFLFCLLRKEFQVALYLLNDNSDC